MRDIKKKKDGMARLYRQFSRQKYNKYKHQFPKMRESEIIAKIIKEWQNLDNKARSTLKLQYIQRNFLKQSDSDVSREKEQEKPMKLEEVKHEPIQSINKKDAEASKNSAVVIFKEKISSDGASDKVIGQSSHPQEDVSGKGRESESVRSMVAQEKKTIQIKKQITHLSNGEYIQFFKYYYDRLNKQHPKWTPVQISTIIKLLWRKRNSQLRKKPKLISKVKSKKIISLKKLSGRLTFKKAKLIEGHPKGEILEMWKRLPRETKIYWQKQAKGIEGQGQVKSNSFINKIRNLMRNGADRKIQEQEIPNNNFSFMNKIIEQPHQ